MSNVTLHTTTIGESYNDFVDETIHGFTNSNPVVFRQLLVRKGNNLGKVFCFETSEDSVHTADDNRKVISKALLTTLVSHIFKLVLYFN